MNAVWATVAYLGYVVSNIGLRIVVGRFRPGVAYIPHRLPEVQAGFQRSSYPSGHAGAALFAYFALVVLARPWWVCRWVALAVVLLVVIGTQGHVPGWPADEWSLSPRFVQDWERYTLDQVLARFGRPTQVLLHYWSDHESFFGVGVLYEDRGILVEYMGLAQGEKEEGEYYFDPVVICPTRSQLTDINIWLKSPEAELSLTDVFVDLGGGYW